MSEKMQMPENYQAVMVYLILHDAKRFIDFTTKVFGAKLTQKHMRDEHTIMHAEIMIDGSTIMFADATEQYPPRSAGMFVYVQDADKVFHLALAEGATVITQPADQSYGRSAGITDPCGNTWWLTTPK